MLHAPLWAASNSPSGLRLGHSHTLATTKNGLAANDRDGLSDHGGQQSLSIQDDAATQRDILRLFEASNFLASLGCATDAI